MGRLVPGVVAVVAVTALLVVPSGPVGHAHGAEGGDGTTVVAAASPAPSPTPSPTPPQPEPTSAPSPSPSPTTPPRPAPRRPSTPTPPPTPEPSPTEDCLAAAEGAVSFGDVDRDCDGTLLLSEQGEPIQVRRTVELAPPDLTPEEAEEAGVGESEDRFDPTDFVPGELVGFDETSEQGGTIREGSLVYTPPPGFTGEDRYTFLVRGGDGITREAEVVVDVRFAALPGAEPSATPQATPTAAAAVDPAPGSVAGAVEADQRWEPPWLALLVTIAALLLSVAIAWWMFLVVRIHERGRRDGGEDPDGGDGQQAVAG